mmetsp:Transcript_107931/g.191161  ORF Transcript_107931/g.191161 Transcript_107931/m.191161 type:complete len:209 (-) Transcript_107931:43-669(-)
MKAAGSQERGECYFRSAGQPASVEGLFCEHVIWDVSSPTATTNSESSGSVYNTLRAVRGGEVKGPESEALHLVTKNTFLHAIDPMVQRARTAARSSSESACSRDTGSAGGSAGSADRPTGHAEATRQDNLQLGGVRSCISWPLGRECCCTLKEECPFCRTITTGEKKKRMRPSKRTRDRRKARGVVADAGSEKASEAPEPQGNASTEA